MAIALHNYHDGQGGLPPAAVCGKDGKALYSWRVALLPYIEQDKLYHQFNLEEPWDSPHNLQLLQLMPRTYQSQRQKAEHPHCTFFQVFVGKATLFEDGKRPIIPHDFPDGTSSTILIAEAAEAVPWTKPAELVYDPNGPLPPLGGPFRYQSRLNLFATSRPRGFVAALGDASVRFIPATVSERTLRAAITPNGKDTLGFDW